MIFNSSFSNDFYIFQFQNFKLIIYNIITLLILSIKDMRQI